MRPAEARPVPPRTYSPFFPNVASRVVLLLMACYAVVHPTALRAAPASNARALPELQRMVDALKVRLSLDATVTVAIVAHDPRVVSVVRTQGEPRSFRLSIEGAFLDVLSDDELAAALAHELGHVWVSTHHPYLQTERLANQVAMRIVSRDSLERVYVKLWARDGLKGDLLSFLGPPPADETQALGLGPATR